MPAPAPVHSQLDGYLTRVVAHVLPDQGQRVRRPQALRAWLTAYAAATAGNATYATIAAAATPGAGITPAKATVLGYRDVLESLYLLEPVPGWVPTRNPLAKAPARPKHHLVDPALAARLLGVDADALLRGETPGPAVPRDGALLGALFESLVTLSVRVYAQAGEARRPICRTCSLAGWPPVPGRRGRPADLDRQGLHRRRDRHHGADQGR